jgi:hypothetical protein
MYDLRVRRGPEGRRLNVSPARKGWGTEGDDAERRRCGTVPTPPPTFRHTLSQPRRMDSSELHPSLKDRLKSW